jgi:hypothetical protein
MYNGSCQDLPLPPPPWGLLLAGGGGAWCGRGGARSGSSMEQPCSPLMISQSGPNRPSRGPTIVASLRRAPEWMRCDRVDSCPAGRCPKGATVPKLALRLRALIGEQDSPVDGDRGRQGSMMEGRGCRGCQEICRKGPSVEGRCAHCSCCRGLAAWMARPPTSSRSLPGVCSWASSIAWRGMAGGPPGTEPRVFRGDAFALFDFFKVVESRPTRHHLGNYRRFYDAVR